MCTGPDSPITEETEGDLTDSRDMHEDEREASSTSVESEESANNTVIHCGQGDTPKSRSRGKSLEVVEETPDDKPSEKEQRY